MLKKVLQIFLPLTVTVYNSRTQGFPTQSFQSLSSASQSVKMSFSLPRVIGHRGAKSVAPENTLAAIRAAKRVGANFVEVDVMLSKDKVFHYFNNSLPFILTKLLNRIFFGSGADYPP